MTKKNQEINDEFIKNVLISIDKILINKLIPKNLKKSAIKLKAKKILDVALENGLTYRDLRPSGNPGFLALTLVYYAMLLLGVYKYNNKKINARLILRKSNLTEDEPGKYNITLPHEQTIILNIQRTETAYLFNFLSEKYKLKIPKGFTPTIRKDVKELEDHYEEDIFIFIRKISFCFPESKLKVKIAKKIWDDGIKNSFSFKKIPKGKRDPSRLGAVIVFLSLKHKDFPFQDYKQGFLVKDYLDKFFPNDKTMHSMINYLLPFYYKFLSDRMRGKIFYRPIEREIQYSRHEFNKKLDDYLRQICLLFYPKDIDRCFENAMDLYNKAEKKGFNYTLLKIKNPLHIACALFYLLSHQLKNLPKMTIGNMVSLLREKGYSLDESYVNDVKNKLYSFLSLKLKMIPLKFISHELFLERLNKIQEEHKFFERIDNYKLVKLIISVYKCFGHSPSEFVDTIRITRDPQALLTLLNYENIFVKETAFNKTVIKLKYFIENHILKSSRKTQLFRMLEDYIYEKEIQRDEAKKLRNLRNREKIGRYGATYFSPKFRVKKFLLMLGFSPYDGYDMWENKTKWRERYRIWASLHHIDYNDENDEEDNLVFIPVTHPEDIGREYKYLTHNYIGNLELKLAKTDISKSNQKDALIQLDEIKKKIKVNSDLLERAVFSLNPDLLDMLIGWEKESILKAINRLMNLDFSWANNVEKYIPISSHRPSLKDKISIIRAIQESRKI